MHESELTTKNTIQFAFMELSRFICIWTLKMKTKIKILLTKRLTQCTSMSLLFMSRRRTMIFVFGQWISTLANENWIWLMHLADAFSNPEPTLTWLWRMLWIWNHSWQQECPIKLFWRPLNLNLISTIQFNLLHSWFFSL